MTATLHPKWVRLPRAAELTGNTVPALRAKMREGVWPEGVVWRKAPDGRVYINMEAYDQWVEGRLRVA